MLNGSKHPEFHVHHRTETTFQSIPTVDPNFRRSPNPFDSSTSLPDLNYRRSPTFMDRQQHNNNFYRQHDKTSYPNNIPSTVHIDHYMDSTTLPPVNHDQALKRAKIQFTGLGDMFVFYNQLLNGMEQFGVYLVPLNQVSYQMDLCPTHVNNILITER